MDDQRKDHSHLKRSLKRNRSQQLKTHNVPTDDMKNGSNQGGDLLFPVEEKGYRREIRGTGKLLYIDLGEQNETKNLSAV